MGGELDAGADTGIAPDAAADATIDADICEAPSAVDEVNRENWSERSPTVTADGLELLFVRSNGGVSSILASTRVAVGDAWDPPVQVLDASPMGVVEDAVEVSADGLELFVDVAGEVLRAKRADRAAAWALADPAGGAPPVELGEDRELAADGVYFTCLDTLGRGDVFFVTSMCEDLPPTCDHAP